MIKNKVNPFGIYYTIRKYGDTDMNKELKKFLLEKNKTIQLTADWNKYDLFKWRMESPAIEELNTLFILLVKDWLQANPWFKAGDAMAFEGWANIRKGNSYHNLHSHNNTQLTLNYYVATPLGSEIEFVNPDTGTCAVKGAESINQFTLKAVAGMMICVPSWWMHWIRPTFKDELRISISANVTFP